jgi:hypothetical protein
MNETDRTAKRMELANWILLMAGPFGGWKCFHTASWRPKSHRDWSWRPESVEIPGNMPANEFDAMDRYKRFMQERERRQISWCAAIERNPDWSGVNKGWHVHAMWTAEADIWRTKSFKRWANQWGNNKLEPVRQQRNVEAYVAKYVLDDLSLVEFQVNGSLWHHHQKLRDLCPQFFR